MNVSDLSALEALLQEGLHDGVSPALSAWVAVDGQARTIAAAGAATPATVFDLASLTKPLVIVTQAMIDAQATTLKDAYINTDTSFRFDIEVIEYQDTSQSNPNYSQYMTDGGSGVTQSGAFNVQSAHRKGDKSTLNVFLMQLENGLLGWATLPSAESGSADDGVMNLWSSMNGGSSAPYNEGDTLVHEVGHW